MSKTTKSIGPRWPRINSCVSRLSRPLFDAYAASRQIHSTRTEYARQRIQAANKELARGEKIYILGLGCGGHNAGAGLVSASLSDGIQILANHEEERFRGTKHYRLYPELSINACLRTLATLDVKPLEVCDVVCSWDYPQLFSSLIANILDGLPDSRQLLNKDASNAIGIRDFGSALNSPKALGRQLQRDGKHPIICLNHHDNHAYMSYGLSPFATSHAKTLIAVMDGLGDDSSTSIYEGREGEVTLLSRDQSCFDSLGQLFLYLSSSQGGWPPLSSEGRYMGAAAWGNMDRLTNPYYMALRELIHFAPQGKYFVNRRLANWHHAGSLAPYSRDLIDVIGEPILPKDMWDPDRVLNVDDIQHTPVTRDRVDKAAATQMLFEDVVFHVVRHWLIKTGATQLVLTGGTALNCVSNMRLLEKFDCKWYRRYLGRDEKLHLWVPPMPGDAGGPVGSAYHFAYLAGARPRATASKLQHAYYCGEATDESSMAHSLATEPDIGHRMIGDVCSDEQIRRVADIMAFVVSKGGVIGVFQGAAETGPRALGNRSILADPTNPSTLALLNSRVKHREAIRPLAPMATLEAAEKYFELSDGASDDTFNAFNYMVLAVQAKPIAIQEIPAVVHCDGTSRLQIVRAETNPLMHAYLQAMGNYVGAEVSVNTSLNVGSPIVQTPAQAFEAMRKSKGLHAIFMVSEEGVVRAAWHQVQTATKDDGEQLNAWLDEWHAKNCSQIVSYARTRVASAYTLSSSF